MEGDGDHSSVPAVHALDPGYRGLVAMLAVADGRRSRVVDSRQVAVYLDRDAVGLGRCSRSRSLGRNQSILLVPCPLCRRLVQVEGLVASRGLAVWHRVRGCLRIWVGLPAELGVVEF